MALSIEYPCSNCVHKSVCKYKESYSSATKSIEETYNKIDCILFNVEVNCTHFTKAIILEKVGYTPTGSIRDLNSNPPVGGTIQQDD